MISLLLGDESVKISTIVKQVVEIGECIRRYFGITVAHAQMRCSSSRESERPSLNLCWMKGRLNNASVFTSRYALARLFSRDHVLASHSN